MVERLLSDDQHRRLDRVAAAVGEDQVRARESALDLEKDRVRDMLMTEARVVDTPPSDRADRA
jgi:hypothetical protein